MTALGSTIVPVDIERLHEEVSLYLAFMDVAHEQDRVWQEYEAWKKLSEKRRPLRERIADYSQDLKGPS